MWGCWLQSMVAMPIKLCININDVYAGRGNISCRNGMCAHDHSVIKSPILKDFFEYMWLEIWDT